jgi:hypothetical protein
MKDKTEGSKVFVVPALSSTAATPKAIRFFVSDNSTQRL